MPQSVLLIRPLCDDREIEFAEPLGIERLAGYLLAHGVEGVEVRDRRLYQASRRVGDAGVSAPGFYDDLRSAYPSGEPGPAVVGVSLMTAADMPDAGRILCRLKEWWPDAVLVAGGVYATTAPEKVRHGLPRGVAVLSGEGEAPLLAIVRRVAGEREVATPGFVEPDEWAVPYRPDLERYASMRCAVNLQSSRGCAGACAFCATPSMPDGLNRWRPRSIGLVAGEIQEVAARLEQSGLPPVFNFVDDDFGPLERVEELAGELARRDLHVAFALEMRARSLIGLPMLESRLSALRESGLTRVFVGVESLDPATLSRWNKPYDLEGLPRVVRALRGADIAFQPGYILWHADQTPAGAREEVEGLDRLGIYSHRAALSRLIVFEGCALAEGEGGRPAATGGFQPMCAEAEGFYRRFHEASGDLTRAWTEAAVAEPYAAAEAALTGETGRLSQLRRTLDQTNRRSLELFETLFEEMFT